MTKFAASLVHSTNFSESIYSNMKNVSRRPDLISKHSYDGLQVHECQVLDA